LDFEIGDWRNRRRRSKKTNRWSVLDDDQLRIIEGLCPEDIAVTVIIGSSQFFDDGTV
jgi:hypothetical protein